MNGGYGDVMTAGRQVTWVISGCAFARAGLSDLAGMNGQHDVVAWSGEEPVAQFIQCRQASPPDTVLLWLPDAIPDWQQVPLVQRVALIQRFSATPPVILVLCGDEARWSGVTLLHLNQGAPGHRPVRLLPVSASPSLLRRLLRTCRYHGSAPLQDGETGMPAACDLPASLTRRELQTLQMTLQGLPVTEQARRMGVSPKTVYSHRFQALRKLGDEGGKGGNYRLWRLARQVCRSGGGVAAGPEGGAE